MRTFKTHFPAVFFIVILCMGSDTCSHAKVVPTPAPAQPDGGTAPFADGGVDGCPAPVADGGSAPTTVYDQACSNMVSLDCSEGSAADCTAVLQSATAKGITPIDVPCVANATSPAAVRACGAIACTVEIGMTLAPNCVNACAVVKKLECSDAPTCLAECGKTIAGKAVDLKLACLVRARTKAQMQACGSVACR
jgi:hypothetical protein